jgi:two-component system response regulator DesR
MMYSSSGAPDGSLATGNALMAGESGSFTVMGIDDNVLLIDALERRLNLEPGFGGLYRIDDLSRAADSAEQARPTVILLDVDLPGGIDAIALLDELTRRVPTSRVIVFTGFASGDLVRRAMTHGAWGFVSKGTSADRLIAAIRRVVAGEAVIELEE